MLKLLTKTCSYVLYATQTDVSIFLNQIKYKYLAQHPIEIVVYQHWQPIQPQMPGVSGACSVNGKVIAGEILKSKKYLY